MDTIIASIISAVVALVVGFLTANARFAKHDTKMNGDFEAATKGREHSKEVLSLEHDSIKTAIKNESAAIATANATLRFLEDEKNKELGAQKFLDKDRETIVDNTRKLVTEFEKVVAENAALVKTNEAHLAEIKNQQQQNQQLHDENIELKSHLKSQRREKTDGRER